MNDYLKLTVSNLKRRKIRAWLTMIGIFIGIASIVALIGLGEGLQNTINSQFGFLGKDILSITASGGFGPPGTGVVDPLTDKELDAAKKIPGVIGAGGRLLESVKIEFNEKVGFGYVASIPDGDDRKIIEHVQNTKAVKGRLLEDGDSGVAVIGNDFADPDNIYKKAILPGSKIKMQDKEFKVIGILEKKGNFQLDGSIFINEEDMRSLFSIPDDEYDIIAVQFDENADVNEIQADIEKELRKIRDVKEGEENFAVETPASIIASVNSVLLGVKIFVYIIAGISLLVGGIGIMNTMYTAVVERTKEIGIMKSIGAKNSTIFIIFFIESGLLGAIGGIVGAVFGALISIALSKIGNLVLGSSLISTHLTYQLILGSIFFAFIIGTFFGTLPAIQASKLSPVEALRFKK